MSAHNPYFNETRRPLAYFISFRCYGTWLHGDERGSVDRLHNTYGSPFIATDEAREQAEFLKLKHSPVMLDTNQQMNMDATIREVCTYRNWLLRALNVRTNHVHAVVTADWQPERVMHSFKSYATRRLIEAARVRGHEVDRVRRDVLGRHHEVALVLAILVVDDDDHPAGGDLLKRLLDRGVLDVGLCLDVCH